MSGGTNAPVIIKKKKVIAGGGHHGGAWKVAYADFVTAMMAFFMLMWLLNATTEKQRKGLADYFSPTIAVNRVSGGGDGSFGGDSVFSENTLPRVGTGASSLHVAAENKARGAVNAEDTAGEKDLAEAEALLGSGGESLLSRNEMRHVDIALTDEGLAIDLFASDTAPLFDAQARPTLLLQGLMRAVVRFAGTLPAPIAIEAHVATVPIVRQSNPAWSVSSQHAETARELFEDLGIAADRIRRVTSYADRDPVDQNLLEARNNRLRIVFLRE